MLYICICLYNYNTSVRTIHIMLLRRKNTGRILKNKQTHKIEYLLLFLFYYFKLEMLLSTRSSNSILLYNISLR